MNMRECPTCEGHGFYPSVGWGGRDETTCERCGGTGEVSVVRYCATCGNPADNIAYRKNCCTSDNMIED